MSDSYEVETDVSDSELEEYVDKCYEELMQDTQKVKLAESVYRCPYCPGKKKMVYQLKDLLQHASDVGRSSDVKHRGRHLGLVRFLRNDVNQEDLSSDLSALTLNSRSLDQLFVYPWIGILANVNFESLSGIKSDLIGKGFELAKARILSGGTYAVVAFKRDWSGFYNGIMFDKEFEVNGRGKKDYQSSGSTTSLGTELYGWIAKEDDYYTDGVLGEFLQKNGDLKSVSQVEADERRKNSLLIADITSTMNSLRMRVVELETRLPFN